MLGEGLKPSYWSDLQLQDSSGKLRPHLCTYIIKQKLNIKYTHKMQVKTTLSGDKVIQS